MMMGGPRMFNQESLKPKAVGATLGRLARYFRPFWPALIGVVLLIIAGTYCQVRAPELIGQAVDCYLATSPSCWYDPEVGRAATAALAQARGAGAGGAAAAAAAAGGATGVLPADYRIAGLGGLILQVVGLYVGGAVTGGLQFFLMTWAGQRVLRALRVELFGHLQRLSLGFFSRNEAGAIMSRITNDMDTMQQAIGFALVSVTSGALLIVWVLIKMLSLSIGYALLSMVVIPAMTVVTLWLSAQARKAFRVTRVEIGKVNADLQETISGVREVQAFGREEANIAEFREVNAANRDANIRAVSYTSALQPALEALGYVGIGIVAVGGGLALLRGGTLLGTTVTLGLVITFLGYSQRFNQPIAQIATLWTNIQSAVAGAERIFGLLDEVPEVVDAPGATELPPVRGEVVFDDVWSAYKEDQPVLRGVSFRAEPGQTVAIVGPTGAGKTTIINLIPRFWDPTRGAVLIDGIDVRRVTADSLRRQIGIVLQDTFLFSASVLENIRYGRSGATDDEVMAAAKLARAHEFVERLPQGYETVLGERGTGLSQGQRQLLAIARAALADPRILILDEATSSVDTRTERQIQRALEELLRGRTSFVIAHRLSTVRHADQVLVIEAGEIVERGTHDELLARRGVYAELYGRQFLRTDDLAAASSR
ncbi:MAG TPA: ABC transporter ATP-binding protein [Chloroflexota bacterium]|nr:ABC transporter ATP-binding protein [Chloroflexota bacterium]